MDYNSKYTGEQVEDLLDKISRSPEDIAIPTGNYPDMTVGKASRADTATIAINADNATKAASATTAEYATTAGVAESAEHATTAESATHAGAATKADFATDLSGRVEATPEEFTFRPSAGEQSIRDDSATIRRIKGNSIVWNQLFTRSNVGGIYDNNSTTISVENGRIKIVVSTQKTTTTSIKLMDNDYVFKEGHKYLFTLNASENLKPFLAYNSNSGVFLTAIKNYYIAADSIKTYENVINDAWLRIGTSLPIGTYYISPLAHDLTQMLGAGNEPTTVEVFRALYPNDYYEYNSGELQDLNVSGIETVGFNQFNGTYAQVLPNTTYYLGGNYTSLGFTTELGGGLENITLPTSTEVVGDAPSDRLYTPTRAGCIYADGSNININLSHTGIRDGEYETYKKVTHNLPISKITGGEPLRKAGTVYDEVNETHYIKRVGVVDMGSLTWTYGNPLGGTNKMFYTSKTTPIDMKCFNAHEFANVKVSKYQRGTANQIVANKDKKLTIYQINYYKCILVIDSDFTDAAAFKEAMQGVMLNYELAEPIVTPIETPIDFNYYVEDFGIEEALLTEDSAPFSADIVYQFNATDQIRNNTRNINKLQKSAFIPKGASSQYIRGDGSYGDREELSLSQSPPINNGEFETTDEGDRRFILTPNYYAKSQVTLDNTTTIAVFVTAPEDSHYLAEYWFEFAVDDTLPNIEYYQPNNPYAVFRIGGDMMTDAVNVLHLISSDGGNTFFGEIRSYSL